MIAVSVGSGMVYACLAFTLDIVYGVSPHYDIKPFLIIHL
jgi:hypothetical protein